ncbi:MAG: glutamate-1-semialdehyde 2,1-aminomutase [Nitrososphaerales archaeon]
MRKTNSSSSLKKRSERESKKLYARASKVLVGGVNSPVRSFKGVGRENPLFISRAKGSKLYDIDNNEYLDYICSWGASILGSANPTVVRAVSEATKKGLSFGAATKQEVILGEKIQRSFPSMELLRLVSSGTEATMSAVRVARAFTKKSKVIKFEGCYHGHSDGFLVRGGSGLVTFSIADSAGVPSSIASETLVARYNDLNSVSNLLEQNEIACVIVEPVAGNMGVVPPLPHFLGGLRKLCDERDVLLIFDEVITGFRVSPGGAQALYNVKPDLTILGKIIGGGTNIAAFGGRKDIMSLISPIGPVYQAGTLAGNPIAVASGIATLDSLTSPLYSRLERNSKKLEEGLIKSATGKASILINRVGSMIGLFFLNTEEKEKIENYDDVKNHCSRESYSRFFSRMLEQGIYLPPSPFETIFVSSAHSSDDISKTITCAKKSFE